VKVPNNLGIFKQACRPKGSTRVIHAYFLTSNVTQTPSNAIDWYDKMITNYNNLKHQPSTRSYLCITFPNVSEPYYNTQVHRCKHAHMNNNDSRNDDTENMDREQEEDGTLREDNVIQQMRNENKWHSPEALLTFIPKSHYDDFNINLQNQEYILKLHLKQQMTDLYLGWLVSKDGWKNVVLGDHDETQNIKPQQKQSIQKQ
jgi:hypothetical protein